MKNKKISIAKIFHVMVLILVFTALSHAANFSDVTSTNLPSIGDYSLGAVSGDFDKDGDEDIFVANDGQDKLLVNNGSGVFSDGTSANLPADSDNSRGVTAGDVDSDNDIDIFVANNGINKLLLNNGSGIFSDGSSTWIPAGARFHSSAVFGDIDGDGDLDAVVAASTNKKADAIRIFVNDNKTKFLDQTSTRLLSSNSVYTQKVFLSDFDRDGDLDVLAINALENPNRILLNDGTGKFTEDVTGIIPGTSDKSNSAALADINSDGKPDYIFIANDGGQQSWLYVFNTATSKFEDKTSTNLPVDSEDSFDAVFSDLDGDGDLDVIVANGMLGGQANRIYLNNGSGVFSNAPSAFFPAGNDFSTSVLIKNFDAIPGNEVFITNAFSQQNRLYATGEPTVITLTSFTAEQKRKKVVLRWKTKTEIDNIGFYVLRSESESGGYARINKNLIKAKGKSTKGADYKFKDRHIKSGKTYWYKLEDIDSNTGSTLHEPVSVAVSFRKKK